MSCILRQVSSAQFLNSIQKQISQTRSISTDSQIFIKWKYWRTNVSSYTSEERLDGSWN